MAGALVISITPMIVMFLVAQKYFVRGIATDRPEGVTGDLRLIDYAPRSMLRRPVNPVDRPAFPVIDAHAHLGPTPFGARLVRAARR